MKSELIKAYESYIARAGAVTVLAPKKQMKRVWFDPKATPKKPTFYEVRQSLLDRGRIK